MLTDGSQSMFDVVFAQQFGNSYPAPVDIGLGYFSDECSDFSGCFIDWNPGLLLLLDLMQPPVER